MSSRSVARIALGVFLATLFVSASAQTLPEVAHRLGHFYPDDPVWRDDDMRTIPAPAEHDLSKSYEFVANTLAIRRGPSAPRSTSTRSARFPIELVHQSPRAE
jgi:hypothetical protein